MGMTLIEVLMGLVLIYAVLALLAMKLQESLLGSVMRGRVSNLHALVKEATMQDPALAAEVFKHPLVFALSPGGVADPGPGASRATGPSWIPPHVFAPALLSVLNGGTHPRLEFSTPLSFVTTKLAQERKRNSGADGSMAVTSPAPIGRQGVLMALQTLLANREASWPDFELAVARWFQDIGDRAEGWFKRRSDWWALGVALGLCMMLNVDSLHIFNTLGADPNTRVALADLAEDVVRERARESGASASAPTPAAPPPSPATVVSARLVDANARLREAYFKDPAIARFGHDLQPLRRYCDVIPEVARSEGDKDTEAGRIALNKRYASNADGWLEVIPGLLPVIESAVIGLENQSTFNPDRPLPDRVLLSVSAAASSSVAAATKLKAARTANATAEFERVVREADDAASSARRSAEAAVSQARSELTSHRGHLQRARYCLIQVSAWVRAASTASDRPDTRRLMLEAAEALEASKSALRALLDNVPSEGSTALRRLFLTRADDFRDCLERAPSGPEAFGACMRDSELPMTRLPIGWTEANRRLQFCGVRVPLVTPKPAATTAASCPGPQASAAGGCSVTVVYTTRDNRSNLLDRFCTGTDAPPAPALGLNAGLQSVGQPFAWLWWLVGVLISAVFVALGAPFWFDTLGRLVNLRAAGRIRAEEDDRLRGQGKQPLPSLPPEAASPSPTPAARQSSGAKGSRNAFEDQLLPRELMALQTVLDVKQTAEFDADTRDAIRRVLSERGLGDSDELSAASYNALVRRPAEHVDLPLDDVPTRPTRGKANVYLPLLRDRLQQVLQMTAAKADASVFGDDLRALAVLFRVKQEREDRKPDLRYAGLAVVDAAEKAPATLDEIDETWMNRMLGATPAKHLERDAAARWMDWAWGELGQVERNASTPAASNPRICEYLKAAGFPNDGDKTAWCAAFVTWVLMRHNERDTPDPAQPLVETSPALAMRWAGWRRAGSTGHVAPSYGDVVVVETTPQGATEPSFHVGFYVEAMGADHFWMLGGNQASGSRVCLSRWPVHKILRPRQAAVTDPAA